VTYFVSKSFHENQQKLSDDLLMLMQQLNFFKTSRCAYGVPNGQEFAYCCISYAYNKASNHYSLSYARKTLSYVYNLLSYHIIRALKSIIWSHTVIISLSLLCSLFSPIPLVYNFISPLLALIWSLFILLCLCPWECFVSIWERIIVRYFIKTYEMQ